MGAGIRSKRGMTHYIVGLVAVLAAVAIWLMGQDTQWALVTGWAITSGAVFGGGFIYLLKNRKRHIFRNRWLRRLLRNQRGALLLEALVAVGLLTSVLSAAVVGLSTGSIAVGITDEKVTAQSIARSQLEYTMSDTFCAAPCNYGVMPTSLPAGYTVTSEAVAYDPPDPNLETLVVTVYRDGQAVAVVKGIKANR